MSKAFPEIVSKVAMLKTLKEVLTHVDGEVDQRHVHVLVHGHGLPGGLVLLSVNICQVTGIVVLHKNTYKIVQFLFLSVPTLPGSYASHTWHSR